MAIEVNSENLKAQIEQMVPDINSFCVSTEINIGEIDGAVITLVVQRPSELDEYDGIRPEFECVRKI
ncbi:hypothetical protein [Deefgea piscis]|uniref:hypothetical protein n=1 Tax=Deefgea piscis TaxID=2739061 RepID=UPI001C7EDE07|nr:hypothetical protein [Deefgea piscis]QZA80262.1 hypothetical protein K4H25_12040 [Deefgea piscis]